MSTTEMRKRRKQGNERDVAQKTESKGKNEARQSASISQRKQWSWLRIQLAIVLAALVVGLVWFFVLMYRQKPPIVEDFGRNRFPAVLLSVLWAAPFLHGGGYASEATTFMKGLHESELLPYDGLGVYHHGDSVIPKFFKTLPQSDQMLLSSLQRSAKLLMSNPRPLVVVCHSEPGAWDPALFSTSRCPPRTNPEQRVWRVGRTMFETDRIPTGWVERCNELDEIWVPTEFHREIFENAGVLSSKLVVIPESVDTNFFDPHRELDVFSLPIPSDFANRPLKIESSWLHDSVRGTDRPHLVSKSIGGSKLFSFLSIFKWEDRKGWDILLEAYFKEFSRREDVCLYLLTVPFNEGSKSWTEQEFVDRVVRSSPRLAPFMSSTLPCVQILPFVKQNDMASLYESVHAYVAPSRGEGWGRPQSEAMAMELPVIATNWSGTTAFMNQDNAYLLELDDPPFEAVGSGAFADHLWAIPSVSHLRRLMRFLVNHYPNTHATRLRARRDMVESYSLDIGTIRIVDHLVEIAKKIRSKR